jgi:hypothetical protein
VRILAVTDDTSMQVTLALRSTADLEILTHGSLDEIEPGAAGRFDAALVAYRETGSAMSAIVGMRETLGDLPVVLVTPAPPADLDPSIVALAPPVERDQLEMALREAVAAARIAPEEPTVEPADAPPRPRRRARRSRRRGWRRRPRSRPSEPAPQHDGPDVPIDEERETGDQRPDGAVRSAIPAPSDLQAALRAARRLQDVVDDVPELSSRTAVGHRVVDDVWDALEPHAVVLWALNGAGAFEALSWRGVSPAVLRQRPDADQPLLHDLLSAEDALAYAREKPYPAYLKGLPGVRGDSVVGAALRADGETHGIVVVAGDGLRDVHAAELRRLVTDHAMLLGIAAHLELLRRRARIDTIELGRSEARSVSETVHHRECSRPVSPHRGLVSARLDKAAAA